MSDTPYTICHVLCALNGKIGGPFLATPAAQAAAREYGRLRLDLQADAWLYGTITAKEFAGTMPPPTKHARLAEEDFRARTDLSQYLVSIDPLGEVGWAAPTFRRPGCPDMHVIEVLGEQAPESSRRYLRSRKISYITAGDSVVNCKLASQKLHELFGIQRMLVCGGGAIDWAFLRAGLLDELSLVVAPAVDGSKSAASVFDTSMFDPAPHGIQFDLQKAEPVGDHGALHLTYLPRLGDKA